MLGQFRRVMCVAAGVAGLGLMAGCGGGTGEGEPDGSVVTPDAGTPDSGTPEDAGTPDTNLVVARFNPDGTPDTSFGTAGVVTVDLGAGEGSATDSLWSMDVDGEDRLLLFGQKKADERADIDRVVVRLTKDGELDSSFATGGTFTFDTQLANDNAKNGFVQADGKIFSSGYASILTGVGSQKANALVLLRLNTDGTPDEGFGTGGIVVSNPMQPLDPVNTEWGMAEAYAAGRQSTGNYVTTGYGRAAASGLVDVVSFRYTEDGSLDPTWATAGAFIYDAVGENDRGRNLTVLSDDRVLMVGSATTASGQIDAMALMLTADGALDTSFGTEGVLTKSFERKDQALFGVASNETTAVAVGYRSAQDGDDADAVLLIQPLGGRGETFFEAVALSDTLDDRLWAVTFDDAGNIVATGVITVDGDSRIVVARFTADGTLDTSFGAGGIVELNVVESGAVEVARAVVVQSDGKIVIAGSAEAE